MKRGRKDKYETHVKPNLQMITELCSTHTEKQIAKELGIANSTFADYKNKYPELADALEKGRKNLVGELRSALIRKAKGYRYTETKTVALKMDLPKDMKDALLAAGFTKEDIESRKLVLREEKSEKEMSPDVAALNLALKNYDKENWANDPQMMDLRKKEFELRKQIAEDKAW